MTEPTPIRKLPRRIEQITLPEPYDSFVVSAWLNFPRSLGEELNSRDEERTSAALRELILKHDLVDFDGEPFPPADDPAFWDAIPTDLGAVIVQAVLGQVGKLNPKSAGR